jgi:hypothetical protein
MRSNPGVGRRRRIRIVFLNYNRRNLNCYVKKKNINSS